MADWGAIAMEGDVRLAGEGEGLDGFSDAAPSLLDRDKQRPSAELSIAERVVGPPRNLGLRTAPARIAT